MAGDGGVFLQRDHTTVRDVVLLYGPCDAGCQRGVSAEPPRDGVNIVTTDNPLSAALPPS